MTQPRFDEPPPRRPGDPLARLAASLDGAPAAARPVERWNPPFRGDHDMRIAADGTWHYRGSPIGRSALVKLFASVLRRDGDGYELVTPVERYGITVEDAPFLAVEMAVEGDSEARQIALRTNLDDLVRVGPEHPLRFERGERDGVKPYVLVRGRLWARLTRALTYDLLALGEERGRGAAATFGIAAAGRFFAVGPAAGPASL